jgi:hypothetical protein
MRTSRYFLAFGSVLGCMVVLHACGTAVADLYDPLTIRRDGGGTGGSDGGGGTGGTGGSIPAGCDPSQNKDPVANTCGVFVSTAGDDGNPGTKDKPLKTLTAAVAKGATIYACAGATPFKEALVVDKAVTLFGALDCGTWLYDAATKTQLTAGNDEIPLKLTSSASGSDVYDFAITADDAMADGGSSIAVIADGVTASFTRTDITAGNGKDGLPGTTPADPVGPTDPNDASIKGNDGKVACMDPAQQFGGAAKENMLCPAASGGPIGGKGGAADTLSGSNGDVNPATAETALGGQGQPAADPTWSCTVGQGAIGAKGGTGDAGIGAQSTEIGTIDKDGYAGVNGGAGGAGKPGQGGGGGGGAKGKTMCAGASGGGGGAGGCGGHGGTGGKAGGASIGIVSLGATLSFEAVTIALGAGGKGGDGGDGQGGGTGGNGGNGGNGSANGLSDACNGGKGGQGGQGGKGGGGRGGHAIGIAYTGTTAPATKGGVTFAPAGTPGDGGSGDTTNSNMGNGASGVAEDVQVFP